MKKNMYQNSIRINLVVFMLILSLLYSNTSMSQSIDSPQLEKYGSKSRLIVNGKPFLSLAGELHNSSSSNLKYMETIWPKLIQMNLNTVLAPVSWELLEPKEGEFDFYLIDGLINKAREYNLKIVFLWFGSWKNLVSTYVPEWVKRNPQRFPLFCAKNGEKYQMLSTFSKENINADSRAFAAMMRHIKQIDSAEQTVIMIQVENEVGTDFGEKDCSKAASEVYSGPVSEKLMAFLQKNKSSLIPEFKQVWGQNGYKTKGSWKEVFGEGSAGNEIFMAWHLASYIGEIIKAGKKEYNIPMFVNASVGRQDEKLATYPSGGPVPFVMDIWHAAAPDLDMLCPDIYYGDFIGHCQKYTQTGNPLYIPETRAGERGASNALQAFGNFNALGFSPFGIESMVEDPISGPLSQIYNRLGQLSSLILKSESKKQMVAFSVDTSNIKGTIDFGAYVIDYELKKGRLSTDINPELGYALVIETGSNEFIATGKNINIQFSLKNHKESVTGILLAEEGKFENSKWVSERRLNGDEIMVNYSFSRLFSEGKSGNGLKFNNSLSIQRVKLYQY